MNLARARRRWKAWDRYASRCDRLSPVAFPGPGAARAIAEEGYRCYVGFGRRLRTDEAVLVGRVLAALDADGGLS